MKNIGVIGCGLMGQGMVRNLLKNGYHVFIFDINDTATIPLVEAGAIRAKNIGILAKEVDVILLSLPSPIIIYDVLMKEVFPFIKKDSYVLDMSTNDVEITRDLASEAAKREIAFFDCPLSGGPKGANTGTLTVMVGGPENKFSSILPVLKVIGENIEYIGENGAGQIVKLCNNMMVGGIISLASETLLTGEKLGVSKEKIADLMQKGSAQTKVMDVFGPSILAESFDEVTFSLANMMKDIQLYQKMTDHAAIKPVISKPIEQLYQSAMKAGKDVKDATAVYEEIK